MSLFTNGPYVVNPKNTTNGSVFGADTADLIGFHGQAPTAQFATPVGDTSNPSTGGLGSTAYSTGDAIRILKLKGLAAY